MTIEEKAKAYDKAINRAINHRNHDGLTLEQYDTIEVIFPELAESEDERVRNVIRGWIYTQPDSFFDNGISKEDWLAWLEKQDESDETKAKIFLINKGYPIDANGVFPTYEEMYNIIREGLEHQGYNFEQKSVISMDVNSETEWDDIHKFLRTNLDGEKVKILIIREE